MNSTFTEDALLALHRVLTRTRTLAYQATDTKQIARVLDDAEYLATLVMQSTKCDAAECLADFRAHLCDIETKYSGFDGLVAGFDESRHTQRPR